MPQIYHVVMHHYIKECFQANSTLVECHTNNSLIDWFVALNKISKELGASSLQRNSVPYGLDKDKIEEFLVELMKSSETWKSMKLVVLGHGQIGKTTMLAKFKNLLDPTFKA